MKKLFLLIIAIMFIATVSAEIKMDGRLPRDGNRIGVQSGRSIRLYDAAQTALEHLDENTFATHANWDVTNDLVDSGGDVEWTWVDDVASTLTQVNADQALVVRNVQSLILTYDVTQSVVIAGGTVTANLTGICASTALDLTVGTDKTVAITTGAAASSADFVLTVKADGDVTAGTIQFDNFYLTSYYESPLSIATAGEVILTVPDNAVELIVDPKGTEIKVEVGSAYYIIDTAHPIPCSGSTIIKIGNDSGGTATVNFYFNMI
jgi:hypothetical protein